jgi:hypothetical protein
MLKRERAMAMKRKKGLTEGRKRERTMAKERKKGLTKGRKRNNDGQGERKTFKRGKRACASLGHPAIEKKERAMAKEREKVPKQH